MGIQLITSSQSLWVKMLPKVQSYLADKGKFNCFTFSMMFILLLDSCEALLMPFQMPVYIHLQHLAHRLTLKPLHLSQINLMIKIMNILYMPTVGK